MAELKGSARQEVGPTQADMLAQIVASIEKVNQRLDQVDQAQQQKPAEPQRIGLGGRVRVLLTGKP